MTIINSEVEHYSHPAWQVRIWQGNGKGHTLGYGKEKHKYWISVLCIGIVGM